jgi:hypothetical protein
VNPAGMAMGRASRRLTVALVGILGVLFLAPLPASATFAASRPLPEMSVATATVQPPMNVSAQLGSCSNGRWMSVTVTWDPSSSSRISGYTVRAYRSDGQASIVATTDSSTTSVTTTVDKLSTGSTTVTFTVTAQVSGWTAESLPSGPLTC